MVQASTALPPRKINVQKFTESRGPELESLHSIVAKRVNNDFRSQRNKRRRTTSYDNQVARKRYRKRQKKIGEDDKGNGAEKDENKKVSRRVRRRIELRKNPENGFCVSGDGTKRLRTHVWYAKRFAMIKLWGFHLPLGLQGRGRGSRALLKWFKQGVLVHDASYNVAVQLEGPEDSLVSILRMVLLPSPSAHSEDIISGVIYGSAMLHHVGAHKSQAIAPVTYFWRPRQNRDNDVMDHNSDECYKPENMECCSSFRQIWVWIHASAFSEGFDALKLACQKEMDERGILIKCFSREGQLAKLEVMGLKAFQLLQKILHPVTCISENKKDSAAEADNDSQIKTSSILENEENISSHAILSLCVKDPRILPKKRIADVPGPLSTSTLGDVPEAEANKHVAIAGVSDKENELLPSLCSEPEGNSIVSDNNDLWDSGPEVRPPAEESVLCMEKHHLRMGFFCLDDPNSGMLKTSTKVQCSRSCPLLLLKNNNQKGSLIGWSVVLPLSWVRAFWTPLVSKGAHAIGLREKHWVACEMGLPFFPSDFPDCNAYSCFMATEAAASNKKRELRPPAIRPWRVPVPPPWDSIRVALDKGPTRVGTSKINSEEDMVSGNSLSNSDCGNCHISSSGHYGNPFDETISRTSFMLIDFLKEIQGGNLLLFPKLQDRKMSIFKFMKDESKLGQGSNGITRISDDRRLCFLRVLLHAYKEGVFEEGAVVCAPQITDISLLTSRSENDEGGLQIPESAVRSYFKEQSSSNWELQIPEDAIAMKSHRWPIGFVTTGFVRGSKKPVAEAFCESVLLARLREEQWNNMPTKWKKEIYVLVRNLRSSAYRLALATIVLEQQEEDVEFM